MKKTCLLIFVLFIFGLQTMAKEVLAPAVQFNIDEYKDYFMKSTDYKINLKSRSDFKISCDADIIGVTWKDTENLNLYDIKNENGEIEDMKSVILKTKFETYSYIRLYKATHEIVNLIVSINPIFKDDATMNLGLCQIEPYREE